MHNFLGRMASIRGIKLVVVFRSLGSCSRCCNLYGGQIFDGPPGVLLSAHSTFFPQLAVTPCTGSLLLSNESWNFYLVVVLLQSGGSGRPRLACDFLFLKAFLRPCLACLLWFQYFPRALSIFPQE